MFLLSRIFFDCPRPAIVILFCREIKIYGHATVCGNIVANEIKYFLCDVFNECLKGR